MTASRGNFLQSATTSLVSWKFIHKGQVHFYCCSAYKWMHFVTRVREKFIINILSFVAWYKPWAIKIQVKSTCQKRVWCSWLFINIIQLHSRKKMRKIMLFKVWSHFSTIFVHKIKQNYVMCNYCTSLIAYKHSTGTDGMPKQIECCLNKSLSTRWTWWKKKWLHILVKQKASQTMFLHKLKIN